MDSISLSTLPDILTARDIAKILSIGYTKSLRFIRFSGLPYVRLGNVYRVSKSNFVNWFDSSETKIIKLD